ncbi:MAG: lipoprotein-releasing system ATP-binding protein LolD [Thermodesulfovibrio sp.]|nr:lipoprotein-releasing system ATP-binding protein LolD [Thermodesulfovibrio sp.]
MKNLVIISKLEKSFYTPAGELKILKGIDAVFNDADMVGIVGASGAGKSTLLHILGTLDKPTSGTVIYKIQESELKSQKSEKGINPFSLNNGELAIFRNRMIGFVFQFHYLLPEFTALENVMMPVLISRSHRREAVDYKEVYDRAEKLLDELGLYQRKNHKPGELSGGEQQRVAVARALVANPKVLLADEPTGNLDTATGEELFKLLMDINSKLGVTLVLVTHNQSLSARCHRVLEMVDGKFRG